MVIYSAVFLTLNCGAKGVNMGPKHTVHELEVAEFVGDKVEVA